MAITSATSVEKVIESFPIPVLTRISGQLTYEKLREVNKELNANAASVASARGGGAHGHLALTVSPTVYATLSATPFTAPVMPTRGNPAGMTGPQIENANRIYDAAITEYTTYVNLQKALRKQLIAAVDPLFLDAIKQPYVGFANVPVYDMLRHLYTTYVELSLDDIEDNDRRMRKPWDPNTPFEALIKQINDAVELADHAGAPYTPVQVVNTAYGLVEKTGVFEIDCRKWRDRTGAPHAPKDWNAFKTFFRKAHKDWEMYTKRNSARTYYGQANAAFPHDNQVDNATINALANFATSTASDRAALSKLTDTVQELTAELKAARTKIDDLQKQLVQAKQVRKKGGKENENQNAMLYYCWTHGFPVTTLATVALTKQKGTKTKQAVGRPWEAHQRT